ncbi:hypothetical protein, conserved [Leishmania shawi]|uniref:Uncharacterized protein n=1 Tax=Leishmania shawi TaxID=5680 RepID=A0ABR3DUP0_9TRYP
MKSGQGVKKGTSDAKEKLENHRGNALMRNSTSSKEKEAQVEESWSVVRASKSSTLSQFAASEHVVHAAKGSAQAAFTPAETPVAPRSRTPTPVMAPPTASDARTNDEEDQMSIPTPSIRTIRLSTSPKAERSPAAAESTARSRMAAGLSPTSMDSIPFSWSDSTKTGTSIEFAMDGASSEDTMSVQVSPRRCSPCAVENGASGDIDAQRLPGKHDDVGHHAAAVSDRRSESSLELCVGDDTLEKKALTPSVMAAGDDEKGQKEGERLKASKQTAPGSSKQAPSSTQREASRKRAGSAGKATRHGAYAVSSADPKAKSSYADIGAKAAMLSQVNSLLATRDQPKTSGASKRKGKTPRGEQRSTFSSRGHDLVDSALLSSHSSSEGSLRHRRSCGSVNSIGEESAECLPNRQGHSGRGSRVTPVRYNEEYDDDQQSVSTTERVREFNAPRSCRDVNVGSIVRGRSGGMFSGVANERSWRTPSAPWGAYHYRDQGLWGSRHCHSLSQSPVRRHGSRYMAVGGLDGAALVQECLIELQTYGRERSFDSKRPRRRRHSDEVTQRRSPIKDVCDGERERRLSQHGRASASSRVSPVGRNRRYSEDSDVLDDEHRMHSHRSLSDEASPRHRWRLRCDSEARRPPPLCADPARFHHISFSSSYTDNDAYATAAVTGAERSCSRSERRRSGRNRGDVKDQYGSAAGQRVRFAVASSLIGGDAEKKEELLESSHFNEGRRGNSRYREEAGRSPRSKARHTRSKSVQATGDGEHLRYDCEDRRGSRVRGGGWVDRCDGAGAYDNRRCGSALDYGDADSDASRRHNSPDGDGCGGLGRSQRYRTPPVAASPTRKSPLRSRCGMYPLDLAVGVQPGRTRYKSLTSPVSSPVRGRQALSAASVKRTTPLQRASQSRVSSTTSAQLSEKELLAEVESKLGALEQQIADDDAEREHAMRRSPFERLYHLNNRRERDERRNKVFQLNLLERIRERILSGSLEEEIARKEERLRKQKEMLTSPDGVFVRLYQNASPCRSSTNIAAAAAEDSGSKSAQDGNGGSRANVNTTGVSSRPASTTRSRMSKTESQALSNRLYASATATKQKKEDMAKRFLEERRHREVEELLIARLAGKIQLDRTRERASANRRLQTPAQLEEEARTQLKKLREEDPNGYEKKLLRGPVLSQEEWDMQAARLWKHGYVSKEKLEAQRKVLELKSCTFHPLIKTLPGSEAVAKRDHTHGSGSKGKNSDERSYGSADGAQDHCKADRCMELYHRGMQAKERGEALRDEHDREARLRILRSRMACDHHFRRRVELDPSLAERFIKSLVV